MQKINEIKGNQLLQLIACMMIFFATNNTAKVLFKEDKTLQAQPLIAPAVPEAPMSQEELAKKKGLLICLDDSEINKFGAVSDKLLIALYQEASPIITSNSLLYTIFDYREKDARSAETLLDERYKKDTADTSVMSDQKNEQVILGKAAFKPERWIIKKINNLLSLLIPVSHLNNLNITQDKVKRYDADILQCSDIELQLGLKVNHMETIDHKDMKRPLYRRFLNYFVGKIRFADYFIDSLNDIFCEKADYKDKTLDISEWFMCLDGHGLINYSIAHLSLDGFKQFLSFLDNKLNTQLLVVSSCYVGGENVKKIYGEIKLNTQQYYSFPIIIEALNDVITYSWTSHTYSSITSLNQKTEKKIEVGTNIDFVSFFKKAKESKGNYSEIMQLITSHDVENTSQIKLPGLEWFSVLDADKKIVSIGSILAKTRDSQKPLDIINFFKKDPEIILLYTDDIPFELKIDSYNLTAIVSMVSSGLKENAWVRTAYEMNKLPSDVNFLVKLDRWLLGKAKIMAAAVSSKLKLADSVRVINRIKKISSTMRSFLSIIHWFASIASTDGLKWFFVNEIQDVTGDIYKNVLILGTHAEGMRVYFKYKDNVLYVIGSKDA